MQTGNIHFPEQHEMRRQLLNTTITVMLGGSMLPMVGSADDSANNDALSIYGSFRPAYAAYLKQDGETSSDVVDTLSRIGLTGSHQLAPGVTGIFKGEWKVSIQNDGTLGDARQAWAGVKGDFGRVAIGKQRPPHYTMIGEVVDIFNHGSSPYAYDSSGSDLFFVNNSISYGYSTDSLKLLAVLKSNGPDGDDTSDMVDVGVGYNGGNFTLGAAFQKATANGSPSSEEGAETENAAVSASVSIGNAYLAAAYQDITVSPVAGTDQDLSSLDVSAALKLGNGYKVKAGIFDFDDGLDSASNSFDGYNLTLEKQVTDKFRIHGEYLAKDFEDKEEFASFTVGIRYDFDHAI